MKKKNIAVKFWAKISNQNKINILFIIFIQIASAFIISGLAWTVGCIIDRAGTGDKDEFLTFLYVLIGLMVLFLSAEIDRGRRAKRGELALRQEFARHFLAGVMSGDFDTVSELISAKSAKILDLHVKKASVFLTDSIPWVFKMTAGAAFSLLLLIWLEFRMIVLILPGMLFFLLFLYIMKKKWKDLRRETSVEQENPVIFEEIAGHFMTVRIMGEREPVIRQMDKAILRTQSRESAEKRMADLSRFAYLILLAGLVIFAVVCCGWRLWAHTMMPGQVVCVFLLMGQLWIPSGKWNRLFFIEEEMTDVLYAWMKVDELMPEDEKQQFFSTGQIQGVYLRELEAIGLRDVRVSARGIRDASDICEWNFEIQKGEFVALDKRNRDKNKILFKLISALDKPQKGYVYIKRGAKEEMLSDRWRKLFYYVSSSPFLPGETIREIVTGSDEETDDRGAWEALRICCLEAVIRSFPLGLNQRPVHGLLSEAQFQLMAIARAVFSGRPVLLLDEATTALDEAAENWLYGNLSSMTNLTVLAVSDHPERIAVCDRVIRLK